MSNSRILLIDDEELVIRSVGKLLTRLGYEVLVCQSGEAALEMIRSESVDLIISDLRMPGMSGAETIRKIRDILKETDRPAVPEILLTGFADEKVNREAEELKTADCIYKPFDMNDFLMTIRKHLEGPTNV